MAPSAPAGSVASSVEAPALGTTAAATPAAAPRPANEMNPLRVVSLMRTPGSVDVAPPGVARRQDKGTRAGERLLHQVVRTRLPSVRGRWRGRFHRRQSFWRVPGR